MPIRLRLALSFAADTLVLVVIGGFLFAGSFRSGLESSLEPGLRTQAGTLAASIRAGTAALASDSGDAGGFRTRDVVAQVLDPSERVVDSTREAGDRSVISRATIRTAGRSRVFTNVRVGREHEPYRVVAQPLSTSKGRRIVVVGTSLESTDAAVARVRDGLLIGGAAAVVVAGVGGWLLAAAALRPVERMRGRAAVVSEHDPAARLPVPATRDEVAALATTINALLARLQAALQRQRTFVADASHELRSPLAVLHTELELAQRPGRTREQLEDAIEHAAREVDRLVQLTDDLVFLARSDERRGPPPEPVSVLAVLETAVSAVRTEAEARDVHIALEGEPSQRAAVAPALVRQAVVNLLANAIRYSPPGGTVTVRVAREDGSAVIEVLDDGPGFPPEFLPDAFERFRRADDSRSRVDGGGAGLGLAIALAVAQAHGGSAHAANRPEGGAAVTLRLPTPL